MYYYAMKKLFYLLVTCLLWGLFWLWIVNFAHAENKVQCTWTSWKCYWSTTKPLNILKDLIDNDDTDIIETQLDTVDNEQSAQFTQPWLKVSATLDSVRQNMSIYLQWIVFLGLVAAVILIIYNWIMLMFSPLSPEQAASVKKRLVALVAWVILITWFFFIIKLVVSVYVDIFAD